MTDRSDGQSQGRKTYHPAGTFPRQPIFTWMREEGLTYRWLARQTGYGLQTLWNVAAGIYPASTRFRARCAAALNRPEHELFLPCESPPADESAA